MSRFASFARSFAAVLSLSLVTAAPLAARADDGAEEAPPPKEGHGAKGEKGHGGKEGHAGKAPKGEPGEHHEGADTFPMKPERFRQMVAERIARARERFQKTVGAQPLPEPMRKELKAAFDAGVEAVNVAVKAATADGTVTRDEAEQVRKLTKEIMDKVREKRQEAKEERKEAKAKRQEKAEKREAAKAARKGGAPKDGADKPAPDKAPDAPKPGDPEPAAP